MGTPSYMAPEQAAGKAESTRGRRVALGAILYECLTGQPLPSEAALDTLWSQVLTEEPGPCRLQAPMPRTWRRSA